MNKWQLRVWHRSGVAIWDCDSPDSYYRHNSTTAKVVLADSPM